VSNYSLAHLADSTLLSNLAALVARDRANTATLLAHIAEVDARRLYLPAAYQSMFAWCVGELGLSEDSAFRRIRAARAAREFPAIFAAVAEGRVHLSGISLLAPYLTNQNAAELVAAASRKSKSEIEQLLAQRFPQPDVPTVLKPLSAGSSVANSGNLLVPGRVECSILGVTQLVPGRVEAAAPMPLGQVSPGKAAPVIPEVIQPPVPWPRVAPLAPERFALQVTIGRETHDKLRHAQALLGHQVSVHDVAQVLDRALDALICRLEKLKFAATPKPRHREPSATNRGRTVPAEVRRAVWERDGGRCTFKSDAGRRCEAVTTLEFDHVGAFARGGSAESANIRLRCRAHNQYAAERTYGSEFMRQKRRASRSAAAASADAASLEPTRAEAKTAAGAARATAPPISLAPPAMLRESS
jgi:5-methylcytosine-specific restriction endonuclease McrA